MKRILTIALMAFMAINCFAEGLIKSIETTERTSVNNKKNEGGLTFRNIDLKGKTVGEVNSILSKKLGFLKEGTYYKGSYAKLAVLVQAQCMENSIKSSEKATNIMVELAKKGTPEYTIEKYKYLKNAIIQKFGEPDTSEEELNDFFGPDGSFSMKKFTFESTWRDATTQTAIVLRIEKEDIGEFEHNKKPLRIIFYDLSQQDEAKKVLVTEDM